MSTVAQPDHGSGQDRGQDRSQDPGRRPGGEDDLLVDVRGLKVHFPMGGQA